MRCLRSRRDPGPARSEWEYGRARHKCDIAARTCTGNRPAVCGYSVHSRSLNPAEPMPTAAKSAHSADAVRRLGRRVLGSALLEALAAPHGVDRYLELIRPSWSLHEARAEVDRGPAPDSRQRHADPAPERELAGLPRRAVRPPDGRDRRRAPDALLLPRLLRARARPHRDHGQGASRGPGLRLPQPGSAPRDGGRPVGGRRRLRPAGRAARAPAADQRRQRHHAGDVDAADALRRGPRRGRDLPPLRADARSTSSTAASSARSQPAIRTCASSLPTRARPAATSPATSAASTCARSLRTPAARRDLCLRPARADRVGAQDLGRGRHRAAAPRRELPPPFASRSPATAPRAA